MPLTITKNCYRLAAPNRLGSNLLKLTFIASMIKSEALKYQPVFTAFLSVSKGAELTYIYRCSLLSPSRCESLDRSEDKNKN